MTNTVPKIQVFNKKNPPVLDPNFAGKVCVIGAFKTEATTPKVYTDYLTAIDDLGDDDTFNGCKVLPILFGENLDIGGVTSILAVNVSTKSGDTWTKTITTTNLTNALASVKRERFDIVFIADTLNDDFLPILTTFAQERYLNKFQIGYLGAVANTTKAQYEDTVELIDDSCYGIIANQTVKVNGTTLDLLQTSAFYCALVASTNVGASLTQKTLPNVEGLGSEYTFEIGDLGLYLVRAGFVVFDCYDRENNEYVIVNSQQPNGYDLYINRVRDYVLRAFALHQFLGERNRAKTLSEVSQAVAITKDQVVNGLDFLADIEYNIEKKDAKTMNVNITKLLFDDTFTEIDVYVTIEVQ